MATQPQHQPSNLDQDYPVRPVPFTSVHLTDDFWAPKIEVNRTASIPTAFQKCEETNRVKHFLDAASTLRGENPADKETPGLPFDDTDIYKVIEGASYSLSVHPDSELESYVDGLIAHIASAQEPDGYLYTARTINPEKPHEWSGKERWVNEENQSHELYNSGHLFEAAVAHYQATGKRSFLDIAIKNADLLTKVFGPGKRTAWPGHEIVEMALAKLYRVTGNSEYLNLAKFFLDARGGGGEYWQAHEPVVQQREAVGHAVRAAYLYSGMADVAALTGDASYLAAIDALWENVVSKKLYITGGIGSTSHGEAFGPNYDLPNMSAYNETCAAIGNNYWNYRLFLLHGDAKYIDVMERTLYNGLISGVSLDGKSYFYPNPLQSRGQHERSPWFGCACCPGNITRFIASVPGYVYAVKGDSIYTNLFVAGSADLELDGGRRVSVVQETQYPWSGKVVITVNPAERGAFEMRIRIPGWAREEVVPSDLYKFSDESNEKVTLRINGQEAEVTPEKGYVVVGRTWDLGDRVELELPMPVRRIVANSKVAENRGRVAFQRGPIVYCAEWPDNAQGKVLNLIAPNQALTAEFDDELLNGVVVLRGFAVGMRYRADGTVEENSQPFVAIPYFAWANRGPGEMTVWLPTDAEQASPAMLPTIASRAKVTTSGGTNPMAINALNEPKSSHDGELYFHWWPKKGTKEWVEYTLAEPAALTETSLYWFHDDPAGECRVPKTWRMLTWDGAEWKPVNTTSEFGVKIDCYNCVTFESVTTDRLRLEVELQDGWSAGIEQWRVK